MKKLSTYINEQNIQNGKFNGFVILKPGFCDYEDEFCKLLKAHEWKVVDKKKQKLSLKQAQNLYLPQKDKPFYNTLCDYMTSGDCVCMTCKKKCDDPIKDMDMFKAGIRDQWAKDEMKNAMHSSDSMENVARESDICM